MSKVTLKQLNAEAERVFGPDAWAFDSVERGVVTVQPAGKPVVAGGRILRFHAHSWQAARRLALACLRAMQPVGEGGGHE